MRPSNSCVLRPASHCVRRRRSGGRVTKVGGVPCGWWCSGRRAVSRSAHGTGARTLSCRTPCRQRRLNGLWTPRRGLSRVMALSRSALPVTCVTRMSMSRIPTQKDRPPSSCFIAHGLMENRSCSWCRAAPQHRSLKRACRSGVMPAEVALGVPPSPCRRILFILRAKALERRPGLDQRAIDGEGLSMDCAALWPLRRHCPPDAGTDDPVCEDPAR